VIVLVCLESPSPSLASRAALRLACGLGDRAKVVVLSVGCESAGPSFELARRSAAVRRIVHLSPAPLLSRDEGYGAQPLARRGVVTSPLLGYDDAVGERTRSPVSRWSRQLPPTPDGAPHRAHQNRGRSMPWF
jgi:hypothetical protein